MSIRYKLSLILAFTLNLVIGQNFEWKNIQKNFYQTTIFQKSNELLRNQDSLKLTPFSFQRNEKINLSDSTKQIYPALKITFENFKEKISLTTFNPELTLDSEFLIKFQTAENTNFEYEFYLLDSVNKKQLDEFKKYLKDNFEIQKLVYISNEEAMNEAAKTLGINAKELFDENIFPTSIRIQTNKKLNYKNIEKEFSKILDSSTEKNPEIGIYIFKIET